MQRHGQPTRESVDARLVCPTCAHVVLVGPEERCAECGGSLTEVLRAARGVPPPLPPRALTRAQRQAVWRPASSSRHALGTFLLTVAVLMVPVAVAYLRPLGVPAVILGGLGMVLRRTAWPRALRREQRQRLRALRWGLPAAAELTRVERDFVPSVKAGSVARLAYVFTVHGELLHGDMPSPHALDVQRRPGERIWVVYLPEDPRVSALWPPGP
ncbi:hypothetical protein HUA78_41560 [Myxococcus sp. CA033]|uniref:hypothetical protein n=1 Tax=Myxococcus sp. CA033 TaxID=2741516 RepID=UPI00157B8E16|nr:hypothetical protein [Myxococcus sp. CA033]NTX40935.1 hypothetical protein [Myxococcus sp. CA033]